MSYRSIGPAFFLQCLSGSRATGVDVWVPETPISLNQGIYALNLIGVPIIIYGIFLTEGILESLWRTELKIQASGVSAP